VTTGTPAGVVRFFDDFGAGRLDRARWSVRITGPVHNDEEQAYIDDPSTVYVEPGDGTEDAGGRLVLHARYRPGYVDPDGRSFDFVSSRLDTRDTYRFRYGRVEARMRLPVGRGLWPAFWALGTGSWPDTGEIDVMEQVGDPDWVSSAVHGPGYCGESGLVNHHYFDPGTDVTSWHVYTADWGPDAIAFAVDGRLRYRVTRAMTDFVGSWAFDDEKFLVLNLAVGGTYPFKWNGIREPYRGVAAPTVEAIRDDRARVLVDWVRVTDGSAPQ